jgi:hypothetical protein
MTATSTPVLGARPAASGDDRAQTPARPSRTFTDAVAHHVAPPDPPVLRHWLRAQAVNIRRHYEALRPFANDEFGTGSAAPTAGHILAVNDLMATLRKPLARITSEIEAAAQAAVRDPSQQNLTALLQLKSRGHDWVRATEKVWDFYFELFGQRQSRFGPWLAACDRVATDCYQYAYLNLGKPRSIPAPPPFSYMRTGFSPATYRRGVSLRRLGRLLNPFPLVQLPYHRLVNPWTLGAMLHEVSHNLQNDLGLQRDVPTTIARRLQEAGCSKSVVATWVRWNRETFADMCGVLLGGEAFVGSLIDVLGRDPQLALAYSPLGPHPTPYLRTFISTHLLERLGFTDAANRYSGRWRQLYPDARGTIPGELLRSFDVAMPVVVDAICYTTYPSLGSRSLAQVLRFEAKEQRMIEEAAQRLATGVDPGVVPERFLISAVRVALNYRLADPDTLMRNFYVELGRR